jgi:hypothetical protein
MMSEGQMWNLAGLRPQTVWHPESRRRARRGWATLLVLASAGAACGLGGDGAVFVASCEHFVTTVRTDKPSYAPGHTVIISVTQANDGPVCTIPPQPCGAPEALPSAYNSSGEEVWDSVASKVIPGNITCPPEPGPSITWPAYYSETQKLEWSQGKCTMAPGLTGGGTTNPDCPGTQVPVGTYRIVGEFYWSNGRTIGHGPSASATITISSQIPLQRARHRSPGDARTLPYDFWAPRVGAPCCLDV